MDELDVTLGFAILAAELRFTRPVITDKYVTQLHIPLALTYIIRA